jgi:hypothetical protein
VTGQPVALLKGTNIACHPAAAEPQGVRQQTLRLTMRRGVCLVARWVTVLRTIGLATPNGWLQLTNTKSGGQSQRSDGTEAAPNVTHHRARTNHASISKTPQVGLRGMGMLSQIQAIDHGTIVVDLNLRAVS